MEYSIPQLMFIQNELVALTPKVRAKGNGFDNLLYFSEWSAWRSHAILAGYRVDKTTGQLYRQKDNTRTYFKG